MESPFDKGISIWGPKPPMKCTKCKGTGIVWIAGPEPDPDPCPTCDGDGYIPVEQC